MSNTPPSQYVIPYHKDSSRLFAAIQSLPWAIFLDSGSPYSQQGRYDILVAEPVCTLVTEGDVTTIEESGVRRTSTEDPFKLLKQALGDRRESIDDLPFNGGAVGYFSYDLARRLEKLPAIAEVGESVPEMAVGIYQWAVIVDHQQQASCLLSYDAEEQSIDRLLDLFSQPDEGFCQDHFAVLDEPVSDMDKQRYSQAFEKIKNYLEEGDCYQVNLAQRFSAKCQGNAWLAYQQLRRINAAPFSAYFNLPELQILSSSPERFLKVKQGHVETKPIKGTRSRSAEYDIDQQQIKDLAHSHKDRAENLMIVDLLRNDISKNCKKGSVLAPNLFAIESYATVHHLVSTVIGELADGQHAADLLRSCFPGGSITGAPKIRAMEIIEELEPHRRGVYCGAIGYLGFDGNMDTNIAIRTLVHSDNTIRFWAGGGIVYDSRMEDEYQECFDKAGALLALLETFHQP